MQFQTQQFDFGAMWLAPACFGFMLIFLGVTIFIAPQLLAYFVAGAFIFVGVSMIGLAFAARSRVTIRRLDEDGPIDR